MGLKHQLGYAIIIMLQSLISHQHPGILSFQRKTSQYWIHIRDYRREDTLRAGKENDHCLHAMAQMKWWLPLVFIYNGIWPRNALPTQGTSNINFENWLNQWQERKKYFHNLASWTTNKRIKSMPNPSSYP